MTIEQLAKDLLAIIDSEMYVNDFGGLQAGRDSTTDIHAAMSKLQASLAQPEQEQETIYLFRRKGQDDFVTCNQERYNEFSDHRLFEVKTLYTSPPEREWVGLTEDEVEYPHPPAKSPVYATAINTESVRNGFEMSGYQKESGYYSEEQLDEFARAIEAELKVKNT